MHVKSDAVVHYGHTCFSKSNIPVLTVLLKTELNVEALMKVLCDKFASDNDVRLCLFYDAAFEHCKGNSSKKEHKYTLVEECCFLFLNM